MAEPRIAHHRVSAPAARATAKRMLREALELLHELGMTGEAARVGAHLDDADGAPPAYPAGLSAREVEVLALVAHGLTNRQIGARLGISEKTVTNHLTHAFTKANLDNRAAAAAFALRHGLA